MRHRDRGVGWHGGVEAVTSSCVQPLLGAAADRPCSSPGCVCEGKRGERGGEQNKQVYAEPPGKSHNRARVRPGPAQGYAFTGVCACQAGQPPWWSNVEVIGSGQRSDHQGGCQFYRFGKGEPVCRWRRRRDGRGASSAQVV